MLADEQVAEDVLQNVWLRVVRCLIQVEHPERFSAWLFSLTRKAVLDRLRAKYRHDVQVELGELPDWNENEQRVVVLEEVDAALSGLQTADREAVVLYYLEGLSVNEIAEICAVPPGTIKSRLHRARQIMRKTLDP
ncbi:MAG: RNA polymerase sigma factor [Planctomycetales bacterium]|nr:RNA polymerase sigma factor [Planctomycetales bacterium]